MTREEFKEIVPMIVSFPKYQQFSKTTWDMYYEALKNEEAEEVKKRIMRLFEGQTYVPAVQQLKSEKKKDLSWMKKHIEENEEKQMTGVSVYARQNRRSWEEENAELFYNPSATIGTPIHESKSYVTSYFSNYGEVRFFEN